MTIQVLNVSKRFGTFDALNGVNLEIKPGELVALLGPSGSGKTTLLRVIAGLEKPDSGRILFNDEDTTYTLVQEREVGFVFQHYALFRHMSIFENVAFGLRVRPRAVRPSEKEIQQRVHDLLKLVQLDWLSDRYPHQLSGGQRQRIALARALAIEPKVLLLDEPFGALDAKVRKELRRWLRRLHDEINLTSVFVTHDQEEALEVEDRVVVVNNGRIEQVGTPDEVYDHAATPFVYQFLGNVNLFEGRVHNGVADVGEDHGHALDQAGVLGVERLGQRHHGAVAHLGQDDAAVDALHILPVIIHLGHQVRHGEGADGDQFAGGDDPFLFALLKLGDHLIDVFGAVAEVLLVDPRLA